MLNNRMTHHYVEYIENNSRNTLLKFVIKFEKEHSSSAIESIVFVPLGGQAIVLFLWLDSHFLFHNMCRGY